MMDAVLTRKINDLARALKTSGVAADWESAYNMAANALKKEDVPVEKKEDEPVFLNKDSLGVDVKGKLLKDLIGK